jgi:hypothetical protein
VVTRRKKAPDLATLARAAGFWVGEDGEAGFAMYQADAGNTAPLAERYAKDRITPEEKPFVEAALRRDSNPAHRPKKSGEKEAWQNSIAFMVVREVLKTGCPQGKVAIPRVRERLWAIRDESGKPIKDPVTRLIKCADGAPNEDQMEDWVQSFKREPHKMAFAQAYVDHEREIIAEVKKLAVTDPDGSWDRPGLSMRMGSVRVPKK